MPQIWLTYAEAGELLGCTSREARAHAIAGRWSRKKSDDGLSRLKLPDGEMQAYLNKLIARHLETVAFSSLPDRETQGRGGELVTELRQTA